MADVLEPDPKEEQTHKVLKNVFQFLKLLGIRLSYQDLEGVYGKLKDKKEKLKNILRDLGGGRITADEVNTVQQLSKFLVGGLIAESLEEGFLQSVTNFFKGLKPKLSRTVEALIVLLSLISFLPEQQRSEEAGNVVNLIKGLVTNAEQVHEQEIKNYHRSLAKKYLSGHVAAFI